MDTGGLFYAFLFALLIGTGLTPCLILAANLLGLFDQPTARKIHKGPIARVGGIAFALGALVACGVWAPKSNLLLAILAASLIIVIMGSLDDFLDLRVRYKFGGQFLAAGLLVGYGGLSWDPFSLVLEWEMSPWLSVPLTMILLVMMTNAVNLSDGLDGLAGGLTFLSFGLIGYLALQFNDLLVLFVCLSVMGGLLGFLRFNTFPARVFMGDGGSQFLGFVLGTTALLITQSDRSPFSPLLAIFFLGVPLMDLIAVAAQRVLTGKGPFQPDQEHLHHKLLKLGIPHHQVVLIIYGLQIGMLSLAYVSRWGSSVWLTGLYLLLLAGLGVFYFDVYTGGVSHRLARKWSTGELRRQWPLHPRPKFVQACLYGLLAGIVGFFLVGGTWPFSTSEEISYMALGLGILVLGGMKGNGTVRLLVTRIGLYLGAAFILYGFEYALIEGPDSWQLLFQGFFVAMIVTLLLAIHLDQEQRFIPNPMDYLLLFLALIMPMSLEVHLGVLELGGMMSKLLILFFSCEVLLQAFARNVNYLGYFSGVILLSLAARVFW
jgi:UDP-GlcNAc:undecaprenyl-phosphate/decaprenyl-phosphate GlcNAc-1-phosphate transferase